MRVLDAYPIVADRFAGVVEVKGGAEVWATCPLGHANAKVTFNIGQDGRLVVHCFRCGKGSALEILRAVGMGYKDCFPAKTDWKAVRRQVTARYRYRDEAGVTLYETVRMEPGHGGGDKTFCQRRPTPQGGWVWNLDGVRRVLYRLPELLDPANAGRVVMVVAGEKDADNLAAVGVLATTNVNGERAEWLDSYSAALAGRDVVVVVDGDATGRRHANEVIGSLLAHDVAAVRRLALPQKDATAFLNGFRAAGVTDPRELRQALAMEVRAAKKWRAMVAAG